MGKKSKTKGATASQPAAPTLSKKERKKQERDQKKAAAATK